MEQGYTCLDSKFWGVCDTLFQKLLNQKALVIRFSFTVETLLEAAASIYFRDSFVRLVFECGYYLSAASNKKLQNNALKMYLNYLFNVTNRAKTVKKNTFGTFLQQVRLLFEGGFYCNLVVCRCGFYLSAACNKVRLLITSLRYLHNQLFS